MHQNAGGVNFIFMNSLIQDLNIQIHRGNHGSTKASAIDDDDQHEPSYHETVATMIEEI